MNLSENSNLSNNKLYNLDVIDKMCRGNKEQIIKMVEVFIDQISEAILEMEAAYSENDIVKFKKITHKIKPTLTYYGTSTLEKKLVLTENLVSKEIPSDELKLEISNLKSISKEVINEMKNDFKITNI
ncbi:hypothetical protein SAMN05444411_10347 [Lutibacter oricola]|uniref:HPt domain-containing protein n=1 Tax=Lutibacter oricola TaxID=762486 RepID=A0A1H2YUB1_9FLAO|nr:hypothetical protein [Lutibacter oricola]SDX08159.1 hypothetical protein SAMN05444411_10347 [Lutibacter oricola]